VVLPPGTRRVLAPIEQAQVVTVQSNPPQYTVSVKAGLPSGCAKPAGYEVAAAGQAVRVQVFNSMPAGNVICTQIYGIYDLTVPLGSDFDAGKTYTVDVNDKKLTFVAR
jgi:hypothetical protein